jgi:plastocyanin
VRKIALLVVAVSLSVGGFGAVAAEGATKSVRVGDNFFSPKNLSLRKGDTAEWRFVGRRRHNVYGPGFNSPTKKRGTYSRRFGKAGTFAIFCSLHDGMRMTVRVKR